MKHANQAAADVSRLILYGWRDTSPAKLKVRVDSRPLLQIMTKIRSTLAQAR